MVLLATICAKATCAKGKETAEDENTARDEKRLPDYAVAAEEYSSEAKNKESDTDVDATARGLLWRWPQTRLDELRPLVRILW